jgi:hypothetical protein
LIFFFAAETPAKKNAHALPSGLEAGQGLTKVNIFLCDLCASSEAGIGTNPHSVYICVNLWLILSPSY